MFKLINKLFGRKQSPLRKTEEIAVSRLSDWFNKQTSDIVEGIDKEVNEAYSRLEAAVKELKVALALLQNAELRNKSIHENEKNIMVGNRASYVSAVERFVSCLDLSNKGFFSAKLFCREFEKNMLCLTNATAKNYYVLQHFFADETLEVAKRLKHIYSIVKEMKGIVESSPIYNLDEMRAVLDEFRRKLDHFKDIKKEICERREELNSYRVKREDVEDRIMMLKKSDKYAEYINVQSKRKELSERMKALEGDINGYFSALERPLKKYSKVAMNSSIVERYMASPFNMLLRDDNLDVLKMLDSLKQNIVFNTVLLKDKQKDKALHIIGKLNEEYLRCFLETYASLKKKKTEINEKLLLHTDINHEYKDVQYKLEHFVNKSREAIDAIHELERKKVVMNIDNLKNELQRKLSSISPNDVIIVEDVENGSNGNEEGLPGDNGFHGS